MAVIVNRNWWKIGFFVALLAVEVLREMFMVASSSQARPLVRETVLSFGDFVSVQGRWVRTDDGGDIVPQATSISCYTERGECIESGYHINGLDVSPIDISIMPALFDENSVSFRNDFPTCVTYLTRIDLIANEAYRTRLAKEMVAEADSSFCADLKVEPRMELQLAGWDHPAFDADPTEEHFLPIAALLGSLFKGKP